MGARFDKGDQSARRRAFENAVRREHVEGAAFLYAIVETADRLRAARDFRGELALRLDRRAQLLAAIAKMGGCPTFSDLGRALGVTRQSAREIALAAERAGCVELFTDPYDRRALQVGLTPHGRGELERRGLPASDWLMTLLAGLEDGPRRTTVRVLGVIRDRLRAYEQDLRRAQIGVLGARRLGPR